MPYMDVVIDNDAQKRLELISKEMGRSIQDLAQTSIEEAALNYFRHRKDDPARRSGEPA